MFYIAIIYLLIFKLFLAGKDASSYQLKDKSAYGELTTTRIKRWHRDGVALDVLGTLPFAYILGPAWWQVILISLLLRLSVFDIAFNKWASLNIHYLGSTAWADRLFVKVFGINGAIKKSLFFAITIILYCIAKIVFNF